MIYNITFSPTGSSMTVAEQMIEVFDGEKTVIDLCEDITEEINIEPEDVCVFQYHVMGAEFRRLLVSVYKKYRGQRLRQLFV